MSNWLVRSFEESSVLWLIISALIGGVVGASTKFLFEIFLPEQIKTKRMARSVIAKYRAPLLHTGLDLQRRLYSIVELDFLATYYGNSDAEKDYAIKSTLFVIADFLGWVEILRQEIQTWDLGTNKKNRELESKLEKIRKSFSTHDTDSTFRIFRGEQRAIGEMMIIKDGESWKCAGYAEFVKKIENDNYFLQWFGKISESLDFLATKPEKTKYLRVISVHNAVIDLLIFLDPQHIRVPEKRQRIIVNEKAK